MEKEKVLRIVDACFHEFASSYRSDAKKKANELYDLLSTKVVNENDLSHFVTNSCPKCGSNDVIMFTADLDICQKCHEQF